MYIRDIIKSVLFIVSLILNGIVLLIVVLSSFSSTKFISFPKPHDDYFVSAALISAPKGKSVIFNPIELSLYPGEKCFIQYSVYSDNKQGNLLINALYDPEIISVILIPGSGIEIAAVSPGETVMQYVSADGISDIARIAVLNDVP